MIVALDATYSLDAEPSGIAVYSREILQGLTAAHPDTRFHFCYRPHRFLQAMRTPVPHNARRRLLWKERAPAADLFHALNQRVDSDRHARVVCTFHDLFVMTGEYSTPAFRARFTEQARSAAQRADRIIAVSDFTASQVHELLGVPTEKIRVVHHGVRPPAEQLPAQRDRLILFVGAIQKRKNVGRLVRAFEAVDPGWRLVLAGAQGYGADEAVAAVAASPRREDIEITGYLEPHQLDELWRQAAIFAFPSLDEGFGIPVLEAMAHGIPVIVSNRSALPEVAGDAGLLIDPFSTESISHALQALTRSEDLRRQFGAVGLQRANLFSWKKTLDATWTVYAEVLAETARQR